MLETRQQTLLPPESAADVVVRGDATLLRACRCEIWWKTRIAIALKEPISLSTLAPTPTLLWRSKTRPGIDEKQMRKLLKRSCGMAAVGVAELAGAEYRQPHHPATSGTFLPAKLHLKEQAPACPGAVEKA